MDAMLIVALCSWSVSFNQYAACKKEMAKNCPVNSQISTCLEKSSKSNREMGRAAWKLKETTTATIGKAKLSD